MIVIIVAISSAVSLFVNIPLNWLITNMRLKSMIYDKYQLQIRNYDDNHMNESSNKFEDLCQEIQLFHQQLKESKETSLRQFFESKFYILVNLSLSSIYFMKNIGLSKVELISFMRSTL
jgi:signal transduction histidine kinase